MTKIDSRSAFVGFYTTCFFKSEKQAEVISLVDAKMTVRLSETPLNASALWSTNYKIDEVQVICTMPSESRGKGFTFYEISWFRAIIESLKCRISILILPYIKDAWQVPVVINPIYSPA